MVIELTAPLTWNCAVFNRGEQLGAPAHLADHLTRLGCAVLVTRAVDAPPVDKLMKPRQQKTVRQHWAYGPRRADIAARILQSRQARALSKTAATQEKTT